MVAGTRTSTSPGTTSRINISHRPSSSSATSTKRHCHVTFQHFCMQMQKYIQVWQHATLAAHAARCTQRSGGMLVAQTYIAGYLAGPAVTNMNVRPSVCLSIRLSIFLDSVSQGPKKTCFCPYEFNASPWKSLRYRIPIFDEMRVTIL